MSEQYRYEPMLDMFIFETSQLIEQLEQVILSSEKSSCYSSQTIDEIFRIMHTIKGSSAMMLFNNISILAHSIEDLFFYIREESPTDLDCSTLADLVLEGVDHIKVEIMKIKNGDDADGDASILIGNINDYLAVLKQSSPEASEGGNESKREADSSAHSKQQYYIPQDKGKLIISKNSFKAVIYFDDGCEMENIRAFTVIHNLKEIAQEYHYFPADIIENDDSVTTIREQGFTIFFKTDKSYEEMHQFFIQVIFLKDLELVQLEEQQDFIQLEETAASQNQQQLKVPKLPAASSEVEQEKGQQANTQSIISVSVAKLDKLMDLVGEMVIAEAMVTQNPDIKDLQLDNFQKAARQLHKITTEIQDMVMSIRMVPLATTFHKMHRIVRDMCKKLGKEVELEIVGEDTEVDKNIIEHISDPLMHLVRNALDHGIELPTDRELQEKPRIGTITLEAKNAGSDVVIVVKDNGRGLNKEKILDKARENNLLHKNESELSDREIFNLIFLPGFSTKESITQFSGRGVGMDVVTKNIEIVGGSIAVDSVEGQGTTITLKIPLTLAIIDGMNIRVGSSRYTIPTTTIRESFRPAASDIIRDPEDNEMIMVRGECYPILRLHQIYKVPTNITSFEDGILIMVEQDDKKSCIFSDELLGQQQVVVKTLPSYIKNSRNIAGLAGCTLLGDGSISLILDIGGLIATRAS